MSIPRNDLRSSLSIRSISIDYSLLNETEGSIKFSLGQTLLYISIYGPNTPKYNRHEEYNQTTIQVNYKYHKLNSLTNYNLELKLQTEKRYEMFLSSLFTSIIDIKQYPRKMILIKVSIIKDDGSLAMASIIGCALALMESGIKMFYLPVSFFSFLLFFSHTLSLSSFFLSFFVLLDSNNLCCFFS